MTKVGGIQKIMVLWQAVFLVALLLVTAPPSNLTRLCYNGSAAKSHPTTTQIIPPATQANNYKMLPIIVLLFIQNISSKLKTSLPLCKIPVVKHLPVFFQFQVMYRSNRSFNMPPRAYPGHLTPFTSRGGGNLIIRVFQGVGNLIPML